MKVEIASSKDRKIPAASLKKLYDTEPWWPERSLGDLQHILDTTIAVGAWDDEELVGFARAVTDTRFRAYIEDVLLLEEYRGREIGRRLMELLLSMLKDIHVVTLFCQPKLSDFYTELGFKEFTKQVVMHLRNLR